MKLTINLDDKRQDRVRLQSAKEIDCITVLGNAVVEQLLADPKVAMNKEEAETLVFTVLDAFSNQGIIDYNARVVDEFDED